MKSPHQTREKSHPDNPQADRQSDKLASQLPDLTPLQPIEGQREGDSADVKVIDSPLEHRILEMESKLSHELGTMQSKIDSGFSELHNDISDLNDSFNESMDRLENTVDRFTYYGEMVYCDSWGNGSSCDCAVTVECFL